MLMSRILSARTVGTRLSARLRRQETRLSHIHPVQFGLEDSLDSLPLRTLRLHIVASPPIVLSRGHDDDDDDDDDAD
jgi:hypothetical protein